MKNFPSWIFWYSSQLNTSPLLCIVNLHIQTCSFIITPASQRQSSDLKFFPCFFLGPRWYDPQFLNREVIYLNIVFMKLGYPTRVIDEAFFQANRTCFDPPILYLVMGTWKEFIYLSLLMPRSCDLYFRATKQKLFIRKITLWENLLLILNPSQTIDHRLSELRTITRLFGLLGIIMQYIARWGTLIIVSSGGRLNWYTGHPSVKKGF